MSAGFTLLARVLRETSGLALDDDKRYLVEDRLKPILRANKLSSLDDLARNLYVHPHSELARTVAEALTINETSFFRDRALFTALSERLLPDLIAARKDRRQLRMWSAACSTGQEPYSLAMMIDDQMRQLSGWQIDIIGTDLSRSVVETAKRGIYSQFEVQRGLPVTMMLRYLYRQAEHWSVSDYLRAKVDFRVQNLMASFRDLGRFDVIFCRNVLIYFDVPTKTRVLANLADALTDDGILVLGGAERVAGICDDLRADPRSQFVFTKSASANAVEPRRVLTAVI